MAILEVGMLSGFSLLPEESIHLDFIRKVERAPEKVSLYLDSVRASVLSLSVWVIYYLFVAHPKRMHSTLCKKTQHKTPFFSNKRGVSMWGLFRCVLYHNLYWWKNKIPDKKAADMTFHRRMVWLILRAPRGVWKYILKKSFLFNSDQSFYAAPVHNQISL